MKKFISSFSNSFYMLILIISLYYLFFITYQLNIGSKSTSITDFSAADTIFAMFELLFVSLYLLTFFLYSTS